MNVKYNIHHLFDQHRLLSHLNLNRHAIQCPSIRLEMKRALYYSESTTALRTGGFLLKRVMHFMKRSTSFLYIRKASLSQGGGYSSRLLYKLELLQQAHRN